MSHTESISLLALQQSIKTALEINFNDYVWVHAELNEVMENRNGHCYIELAEKQATQLVAKARATIWSSTFRLLKPYFETTTGMPFQSGIKVSLKVSVEFHELYGISLNVKDIDPAYTVGELQIEKQKIIRKLEEDGVIDMNKDTFLPGVIQRIAIISSSTAAGFGDFIHQLEQNVSAYIFKWELFDAQMQGQNAASSVVSALEKIYQKINDFDVVVIIRGGGAKLDLKAFDDYELVFHITQFPLPVLTGIGHERDESIADMVAYQSFKTPTAVAAFLIEQCNVFENALDQLSEDIALASRQMLTAQNENLQETIRALQNNTSDLLKDKSHLLKLKWTLLQHSIQFRNQTEQSKVRHIELKTRNAISRYFQQESIQISDTQTAVFSRIKTSLNQAKDRLQQAEHLVHVLSPERILERGFAMVNQHQRFVDGHSELNLKENFEIHLKDGRIIVKKVD
ncbi:MAG: exodeoxyribonuclease VII large subunit [Bacteroidales bacterium]|nr:exodeoxyribonuclease VII large subunit [Bacteroidales bacterium]